MNSASAVPAQVVAALEAQNWPELTVLMAPDAVITLPDGRSTVGSAALRAELGEVFQGKYQLIKSLSILAQTGDRVTPLRDGVEVLTGVVRAKAELPYRRTLQADAAWTATLVESGGGWRVAALQVSVNPWENQETLALAKYGVSAALVVGLLALYFGFRLGRVKASTPSAQH